MSARDRRGRYYVIRQWNAAGECWTTYRDEQHFRSPSAAWRLADRVHGEAVVIPVDYNEGRPYYPIAPQDVRLGEDRP
jgi:uncharacterized protein YndB with AHSA1/START domain